MISARTTASGEKVTWAIMLSTVAGFFWSNTKFPSE